MSITIAQGAALLNALTGVSKRTMEQTLTQAQVDGFAKWVSDNIAPSSLYTDTKLDGYAQLGNPDDAFTLAQIKAWADAEITDPTDIISAATLNTAGWTHA